jgi:hypothetical protein
MSRDRVRTFRCYLRNVRGRGDLNPYALAGTSPSSCPDPSTQWHQIECCLVSGLAPATRYAPARPRPCGCLVAIIMLLAVQLVPGISLSLSFYNLVK